MTSGSPPTRSTDPASTASSSATTAGSSRCRRTIRFRETITPALLKGSPLIGLAPEDRARQRFDAVMAEAGVAPHYVIETPSAATVCALVLTGDAVGLVNPLVVDQFRRDGLILRPFLPKIAFRTYILFPPDSQKSRLVKDFVGDLMHIRNSGGP